MHRQTDVYNVHDILISEHMPNNATVQRRVPQHDCKAEPRCAKLGMAYGLACCYNKPGRRRNATDLVVLAVMNLHGCSIYAGLQRSIVIWKLGQRVGHVPCSDLIDESRGKFGWSLGVRQTQQRCAGGSSRMSYAV